jgi:EAL domain-containing protein (putative c-di-GMP-specific phosphodiesterase class I)
MEADASMLQRLSDFGVVLALDDFGTGYSSLLRAKYYPIDNIRIRSAQSAAARDEPHSDKPFR